jgi:hypothetical protein
MREGNGMPKGVVQDRRITERYALKAKILYEPSAELAPRESMLMGKALNISRGGFCIRTQTQLAQSQIIRVHIPVPEVKAVLPTLAEICWVEELKKEKGYSVGLRFLL